jgi:hypothetical protein
VLYYMIDDSGPHRRCSPWQTLHGLLFTESLTQAARPAWQSRRGPRPIGTVPGVRGAGKSRRLTPTTSAVLPPPAAQLPPLMPQLFAAGSVCRSWPRRPRPGGGAGSQFITAEGPAKGAPRPRPALIRGRGPYTLRCAGGSLASPSTVKQVMATRGGWWWWRSVQVGPEAANSVELTTLADPWARTDKLRNCRTLVSSLQLR